MIRVRIFLMYRFIDLRVALYTGTSRTISVSRFFLCFRVIKRNMGIESSLAKALSISETLKFATSVLLPPVALSALTKHKSRVAIDFSLFVVM